MSRAHRGMEQGSFYESFSDLIFLTLIVFVVLVLALVLRLRLTRDAVAAQSDTGERQVAELAQDNARLRSQTQELAARFSAGDERTVLARQETGRLAQEAASLHREVTQAASLATAQPRPVTDRRPMSIAGVLNLPHPDTPTGRAEGFSVHASAGAGGTNFFANGISIRQGSGLGFVARDTPIHGEQIETFLAMLAYGGDPPQAVPMQLQFYGNFMPTRNGISYPPARTSPNSYTATGPSYWHEGSLLLTEHPVRFAWGVAMCGEWPTASVRLGLTFSHVKAHTYPRIIGWIQLSEVSDPITGEPPERALHLRVDRLTADAAIFAGRELPLPVLSILLACNSGRPVLLPPEVPAALERRR